MTVNAKVSSAAHYADKCMLMNLSRYVCASISVMLTMQVTCNCDELESHAELKFHLCEMMTVIISD